MEKKLRFGDLVRNSGRPEVVSLWVDPRRDRRFTRAVQENRVLTVVQEPGTKKRDFGKIGFDQVPHAAYLIFPRPLPKAGDARVIGINYELIEEPVAADPVFTRSIKPRARKERPEKPKPREKTFDVIVRRTAKIETVVRVTARDQALAEEEAVDTARREPFALDKAIFQEKVVAVESAR